MKTISKIILIMIPIIFLCFRLYADYQCIQSTSQQVKSICEFDCTCHCVRYTEWLLQLFTINSITTNTNK